MYVHKLRPETLAGPPNTLDDLLYCLLVDKVVQAQLVWVLKFELVVICKQTDESKRFKYLGGRVGFLYELAGSRSAWRNILSLPGWTVGGHTFITDGNISLCIRYVNRLVWYAPDVMAKATSTAFCRISTATCCQTSTSRHPDLVPIPGPRLGPHSPVLPFRIM